MRSEGVVRLREALREAFWGRDEAAEAVALALVSGQSLLFVGPTGCGKTTMLRKAASLIERANCYVAPLACFWSAGHLFKVAGRADVFIAETFGGSQRDVLGAFEGILWLRTAPSAGAVTRPLGLFGCAWGFDERDGLPPRIRDAFLLRCEAGGLLAENPKLAWEKLLEEEVEPRPVIAIGELQEAAAAVRRITLPAREIGILLRTVETLRTRGAEITNARLEGCMRVLKASAFLAGAEAVDAARDFAALRFCLWERLEDRPMVEELLAETVRF